MPFEPFRVFSVCCTTLIISLSEKMRTLFHLALIAMVFVWQQVSADGTVIVEETEYNKESIGKLYTYSEKLFYLNLINSPDGFLKNNAGIERMLATAEQAEGNDIHIKESVKDGTKFRLVKIFKEIHTNLDEWDPGAREMYLSFAKDNPDVDRAIVKSGV